MKTTSNTLARLSAPARFFYTHAGYAWDPRIETKRHGRVRCALGLAAAEQRASELGYTYEWSQDDLTNREWTDEGPEYYTWVCVCRSESGQVIASLGGIDFGEGGKPWGDPYMRVVQAELAAEGLGNVAED